MSTLALSNQLFFLQCLFVQLSALFSTLQAFLQSAKFVGAAIPTQGKRISIFDALFCSTPSYLCQGVRSMQQVPESNINSMPISLFNALFAASLSNCSHEPFLQVRSNHSCPVPISLFDAIFAASTSNDFQESFLQPRSNCCNLKAVPLHPSSALPPFASPHVPNVPTTEVRVFASPQARTVDPLTPVGHVLIDLQPGSCESDPLQSAGSDPSNTHLPASKIPVSVAASPALCVPKSEPGPDGDYVSTNAGDLSSLAQAAIRDPLNTCVFLRTESCESDLIQPVSSDPSTTQLPASKIPVSLAASPALGVPSFGPPSKCPTTQDNPARRTEPLSIFSFPYFRPVPGPFRFPPESAKRDDDIVDACVCSFGRSDIGTFANSCFVPTSESLESNTSQPDICLPIDTLLSRPNYSESSLRVSDPCEAVKRIIHPPRLGLEEFAFDSPATCGPMSVAASPTLTAPAVDATDDACVSPKSCISSIACENFGVVDACVNHLKPTTTSACVDACDPESLAALPTLSASAVDDPESACVSPKAYASSSSDQSFCVGEVCVEHSKHTTASAFENACDPESIAALPALRAPAVDAPDNEGISPRSCISSTLAENFDAGDIVENACFSPRSCDSKISDVGVSSCCPHHYQACSHDDRETPPADVLLPEVLTRQPCEATFSILAAKDLIQASMTCRRSFVSLSPTLQLREHLLSTCPPLIKDTVSQNETHHASRSYLAEALLDRFSLQDLSAPCSFSFLPLSTLITLASASVNLFTVTHPAVRFRRAQRGVESVLLRNNVAVRMFSKGAVYYCTLCQATFLSQALCSVCECMICGECDGVQSRFTQFFNSPDRCICVSRV